MAFGVVRPPFRASGGEDDSFIRDFFGLTQQEFLRASPQTLRSQLNVRQGSPFDPQTGLPLRPARTLGEAANFEFAQNLFVNRLAQANQRRAAAAIQAQIGLVQRGGPGSLQQLLSPAFSNLANILGTTTFQPFDFTAGVVSPFVGGFGGTRVRPSGDRSTFGGISDPFRGRSIQDLAQQPSQFDFQDISDIGLQSTRFLEQFVMPSGQLDQVVQQFDQGTRTLSEQEQSEFDQQFNRITQQFDQAVQQFNQLALAEGRGDLQQGAFAEDQGGLFGDQGQDFFGDFSLGDFQDLFASSPFAPSEFGLEGFVSGQDVGDEFDLGIPDESELFGL